MKTKSCRKCKIEKPIVDFSTAGKSRNGYRRPDCKVCRQTQYRESRKQNPEQHKNCDLKAKYGITLNQHREIYVEQNGRCGLCDVLIDYRDVQTDHCHVSGEFRGLLCRSCNVLLGQYECSLVWYKKNKKKIDLYLGD